MDNDRRARLTDLARELHALVDEMGREHAAADAETHKASFITGYTHGHAVGFAEAETDAYLRGWFEGQLTAQSQPPPFGAPPPTPAPPAPRPQALLNPFGLSLADAAAALPPDTDVADAVLFAHLMGHPPTIS
jgi:hypothetical protein